MALYPSLEDMKVDQMMQAQRAYANAAATATPPGEFSHASAPQTSPTHGGSGSHSIYPSLQDYMGLNLTDEVVNQHMPNALTPYQQAGQVAINSAGSVVTSGGLIAPISSQTLGLKRAEVSHGIREVILCKDAKGKIGLRVKSINKGIFVTLVHANTPAALGGLRFGDQILQINGENVAAFDTDKAMIKLRKADAQKLTLAVRDRPFERTITMHKDSGGHIGFVFDHGKINSIVKDSSAARNGILTEHNLLEVNGQNVIGMKDKDIVKIILDSERTITLTIMPTFIFDHMMKCISSSLVKKSMDHSIPDV